MRKFCHTATIEDVIDMTVEEAIAILSKHASSDGYSYLCDRPHMAKAYQMAIEALRKEIYK